MDRGKALRTVIKIEKSDIEINHYHSIMTIGSCFSENIGEKLIQNKFKIDVNPFGVIFNPASIYNNIRNLLKNKEFVESDLHFSQGLWFSYSHHSDFSDIDKNVCLQKINNRIRYSAENLRSIDYLFITFGTSWVYELVSSCKIVSNCHKMPASLFKRYFLSECDITEMFSLLFKEIWDINPRLHIILSISPVRHLKDGLEANFLSKSNLRMAINSLMESFSQIHYFPSFEIVLDDLRDYRFFNQDLVHPSGLAIDYIWQCFAEKYFNQVTNQIITEIKWINNAVNHRFFQPDTSEALSFKQQVLDRISLIEKKYQVLNFKAEKEKLKTFNGL